MTFGGPAVGALVTGGRGRLGGLLVPELRRRGIRTVSLSRTPGAHPDDVVVDVGDARVVADVVSTARPEVIVHLAAVLRGEDVLERNRAIDEAVVAAIRRARTPHVVATSSAAVYGTGVSRALTEDDDLAGTTEYAHAKIAGEHLLRALAADGVSAVTALRVFNIAGPSFPDSLVTRMLQATAEAPVTIAGADRFVRDYIHQSDVVRVLMAAVGSPGAGFRVLNAGAGVAVSTAQLVAALAVPSEAVIETAGPASFSWADIDELVRAFALRPVAPPSREWAARVIGADTT